MIHSDTLNGLSEDERNMLLFILNRYHPPLPGIEADLSIVKMYRKPALCQIIQKMREKVKPEALPIYNSLCQKLDVQAQ